MRIRRIHIYGLNDRVTCVRPLQITLLKHRLLHRRRSKAALAKEDAASGTLPNHLGPSINVRRDSPCAITWNNTIPASSAEPSTPAAPPVNVPLIFAMCGDVQTQSPAGLATHLHGARVQGGSDGWPPAPISFAGNPYG